MARLGKGITITSAILTALCVAPLLLYAAFGPADGNPVGLGLLMVCGAPIFGGATLGGAVIWIVASVRDSGGHSNEDHVRDESTAR